MHLNLQEMHFGNQFFPSSVWVLLKCLAPIVDESGFLAKKGDILSLLSRYLTLAD